MLKLTCSECGNELKKSDIKCQNCNSPTRRSTKASTLVGLIIFLFIPASCVFLIAKTSPSPDNTSAKTKLSPREKARIAKFGNPPIKNEWNDSYSEVTSYLKAIANDPSSISISKCSDVKFNKKDGWLILCAYRGKNAFGAKILNVNWFIVRNGRVFKMAEADSYK